MKDAHGNTLRIGDTVRLVTSSKASFLSKSKIEMFIGKRCVIVAKCTRDHIPIHVASMLEKVE